MNKALLISVAVTAAGSTMLWIIWLSSGSQNALAGAINLGGIAAFTSAVMTTDYRLRVLFLSVATGLVVALWKLWFTNPHSNTIVAAIFSTIALAILPTASLWSSWRKWRQRSHKLP